ncbi:MAG: thioredoxin domain-containing protein [Proteobacteria bacterium]|nr:thioredoxin domain-containing protein [Pseudomonadota bacterium]
MVRMVFGFAGGALAAGLVVGAALAWAEVPVAASATVAAPSATVAVAPAVAADPLAINAKDRVEGSMMAPVTIVEYASLTCSHCADFSRETMPTVRKEWIATGKAKYVLRDLPWDDLALGMAKVARCVPPEEFKPLVQSFFDHQLDIMKSNQPLAEIKKVTRMAGMTDAQVDACIKDPDLHAQVLASKDTAFNKLGVRGTPAIFVNGTLVSGAVPYKDLKKTLDAEYAKATKK